MPKIRLLISYIVCYRERPPSPSCRGTSTTNTQPTRRYSVKTTRETENFFRLARLLLDICNEALRELMQHLVGGELELTNKIAMCTRLSKCRLSEEQKNILFPLNNGHVLFRSLDFTLMYMIFRNVLDREIEPNPQMRRKWGKDPLAGDNSLLAAIERIRKYRNSLFAHTPSTELKQAIFNDSWKEIERAVIIVTNQIDPTTSNRYKDEMKEIKKSSTDPELEKILMEKLELERMHYDNLQMDGNSFYIIFYSLFSKDELKISLCLKNVKV